MSITFKIPFERKELEKEIETQEKKVQSLERNASKDSMPQLRMEFAKLMALKSALNSNICDDLCEEDND